MILRMLRSGFVIALMVTVLFSAGYLYYTALAICPVPIDYRLGQFDDRFGISREEARLVIADAEAVWEDSTGRNLFTYDPQATFAINFIFDERQAYADAEQDFRDRLDQSANMNSDIRDRYESLLAEFETLDATYQEKRTAFAEARDAYNARVADANATGGTTQAEFAALESERQALTEQAAAVNKLANDLQKLTDKINEVGDLGNRLVESYNRNVSLYNDTFDTSEEFTQGDYRGESINIYTFTDRQELKTVLAHEFGHALALDHVEGEESVMYYLMGEQPDDLTLTKQDRAEFIRVCGQDDDPLSDILRALRLYVSELQARLRDE